MLSVGDLVRKTGGDYQFEGVIVAKFCKRNSAVLRFVVEDNRGLLFIFSGIHLELVQDSESSD